jgi:hypothetical protein
MVDMCWLSLVHIIPKTPPWLGEVELASLAFSFASPEGLWSPTKTFASCAGGKTALFELFGGRKFSTCCVHGRLLLVN